MCAQRSGLPHLSLSNGICVYLCAAELHNSKHNVRPEHIEQRTACLHLVITTELMWKCLCALRLWSIHTEAEVLTACFIILFFLTTLCKLLGILSIFHWKALCNLGLQSVSVHKNIYISLKVYVWMCIYVFSGVLRLSIICTSGMFCLVPQGGAVRPGGSHTGINQLLCVCPRPGAELSRQSRTNFSLMLNCRPAWQFPSPTTRGFCAAV